ncbi:MAG: VCBS repeat-containing protein [Pseudomonadota bacterium]
MSRAAPRLALRPWQQIARGALLASALAAQVAAQSVETRLGGYVVRFEAPTDRYGHAIMGDLPEWGRLCLGPRAAPTCVELPETSVFEDIAPRLYDLDGDGVPEAVVVESSFAAGAALVVYRVSGGTLQRIATPPIGTRNRWLAPAGIGDLDGDGAVEIAFVDRPHLAKTLRIWRYRDGTLEPVASAPGLTNHRIGDPFIEGGLRVCVAGPEIITADARWREIVASRLVEGRIVSVALGPYSAAAMRTVLDCGL